VSFCLYTRHDFPAGKGSCQMSCQSRATTVFSQHFSSKMHARIRDDLQAYICGDFWGVAGTTVHAVKHGKSSRYFSRYFVYISDARMCRIPPRVFSRVNPVLQRLFCQSFFKKNACARARQLTGHNIWTLLRGCAPSPQPRRKRENVVKFSCHFIYIPDTTLCRVAGRVACRVKCRVIFRALR